MKTINIYINVKCILCPFMTKLNKQNFSSRYFSLRDHMIFFLFLTNMFCLTKFKDHNLFKIIIFCISIMSLLSLLLHLMRPCWIKYPKPLNSTAYINILEHHVLCTLFPLQDTDGRHKEFLSLVKKQATAERLQYISELRMQLEGKGYEIIIHPLFTKLYQRFPSKSLIKLILFRFR